MSFFESTIVKEEVEHTRNLIKKFAELPIVITLSDHEINKWADELQELLEKTKIFFARLRLSDDEMAKEIKDKVDSYAKLMGKDNFNAALEDVQTVIYDIKIQLDKQ
jgi:hypothetical protein